MITRWTGAFALALVLVVAVAGCPFPPGPGDGDGDADADPTQRDIAQYNELTVELDEARTEFGGDVIDEMFPAGNIIYWLEYREWDPTIHSLDTDSGRSVDYEIALSFDSLNVRVSEEAVAYAEEAGEDVIYHVYDATQPATEITTVTFEGPQDEQRWWAYAVGGTDLYVIVTETDASPDTKLYRVGAGAGAEPELLTTLESAGCEVGEFWDFGVEGGRLIFIESGRIWSFDLPTNRATWLGNETEVQGTVEFGHDGVLFTSYNGSSDVPFFFDYETAQLTNVAEQIAAVSYRLNETFASSHLYSEDITRWRDYFIYGGASGIFAYNVTRNDITPILLEPRMGETSDVRVDYRYPVTLENGMLYLTALESESGSVGADGPIVQVDLSNILP
jgi:hypothetical protein